MKQFAIKKELIETYTVKEGAKGEEAVVAEITYVDGNFKRCKYNARNNPYTREDWNTFSRIDKVIGEIEKGKHG